ncbi:hydroperoxide isomerase ALOXE3 [Centropristis striata]|uniref:hydroperoxide isomerase ALOXE3 n=1 Tax=Centropristis striata TaxID=184440 RepID=UPI0027DF05EE|nr:hydroperoxide isomerase ALOXE3 [Centropristis striata]
MTTSCQEFEVAVHTSPGLTCGSSSRLWLNLIGSQGETPPISVNEGERQLLPGSSCPVGVRAVGPLGRLLLVRLRLEARLGVDNQDWHCSRVAVRGPAGGPDPGVQDFLCDRWLQPDGGAVELRSGKLCLLQDETEEKLKQQRVKQLQHQQKLIRWCKFVDGAPQCVDLNSLSELGPNLRYPHNSPTADLSYLKGFAGRAESWTSLTELETVFTNSGLQSDIARFVQAHWTEDWFFGFQTLNGSNPLLLRQIRLLPPNLAVTSDMLRPFLSGGSSLEQELQSGTVYLLDYEVLDGVPANVVNGKQTYLCAPLCLLHLNQQGQLVPVAIQLQQTPGPLNPVFLPSDPGSDWLLAKIWVHCADFQVHQLVSHYLKTHMLSELSCVATLRQLPEPHPLHQLLMPHVRTSLQINFKARSSLLAAGGVFDKATGSGLESLPVLVSRASQRLRYRSLCVPDDLADRGVDRLQQSYYGQDARRVWDALHKFVGGWVDLFYRGDEAVQQDSELQLWIQDFNTHGFHQDSGFPSSLETKAEVSKFVTMIIFSCSALHAAVNFSQLDFALWIPNCPAAMLRPPPQVKGSLTDDDITSFLPDANSSCRVLMVLALLSMPAKDFVPLCHYKEELFGEGAPRRLLEEVQKELQAISDDITDRNRKLEVSYPYLQPGRIENSVAI